MTGVADDSDHAAPPYGRRAKTGQLVYLLIYFHEQLKQHLSMMN